MSNIHPTAMIAKSAKIDPSVKIGAYSVIGDKVCIAKDTIIHSHVVIDKNTLIGECNQIFPFATLGGDPQDLKYMGEETFLHIGDRNVIRESCTFHRGTGEEGVTKIGNDNLFMVNTHIAHDCLVGHDNVLANNVGLAGHVRVGNFVVIGGQSGVHQFCRIDDYAMVGAASLIVKDVAAFMMVAGNPAKESGLNVEGMRRKGWSKQTIGTLKLAHKIVFRSGLMTKEAVVELQKLVDEEPKVGLLIESIHHSTRGLVRG